MEVSIFQIFLVRSPTGIPRMKPSVTISKLNVNIRINNRNPSPRLHSRKITLFAHSHGQSSPESIDIWRCLSRITTACLPISPPSIAPTTSQTISKTSNLCLYPMDLQYQLGDL